MKLKPMEFESYKPLREQVFDSLREAILSGELPPGERLREEEIARELMVSRTPVREAIRKLELAGLLTFLPRKGAVVAGILTRKDIEEVFQMREVLEGLAAYLAARRIGEAHLAELKGVLQQQERYTRAGNVKGCISADSQFHELLYQASENRRLTTFMANLQEQIQRLRTISMSQAGRAEEALAEHQELAEAVATGEADRAQELAQFHVKQALRRVLAAVGFAKTEGGSTGASAAGEIDVGDQRGASGDGAAPEKTRGTRGETAPLSRTCRGFKGGVGCSVETPR